MYALPEKVDENTILDEIIKALSAKQVEQSVKDYLKSSEQLQSKDRVSFHPLKVAEITPPLIAFLALLHKVAHPALKHELTSALWLPMMQEELGLWPYNTIAVCKDLKCYAGEELYFLVGKSYPEFSVEQIKSTLESLRSTTTPSVDELPAKAPPEWKKQLQVLADARANAFANRLREQNALTSLTLGVLTHYPSSEAKVELDIPSGKILLSENKKTPQEEAIRKLLEIFSS